MTSRGVEVSEIRHKAPVNDWRGGWEPGPDLNRSDYASFADFTDRDGNQWVSRSAASTRPRQVRRRDLTENSPATLAKVEQALEDTIEPKTEGD